MLDSRLSFVSIWNRLNKRRNELINIFTLTEEEYAEYKLINLKLNELIVNDSYYFGYENIKLGELI